jgi:hypothetical protein
MTMPARKARARAECAQAQQQGERRSNDEIVAAALTLINPPDDQREACRAEVASLSVRIPASAGQGLGTRCRRDGARRRALQNRPEPVPEVQVRAPQQFSVIERLLDSFITEFPATSIKEWAPSRTFPQRKIKPRNAAGLLRTSAATKS